MPSTPTTGTSGNSYATIAEADTYLDDSTRALAWETTDDDTKARALITATRLLEKQCWQGTKTNPAQTLHWPATGAFYEDGSAVDPNTIPPEIVAGTIELAFELTQNVELEGSDSTASNIKSVKAGSAQVEFWRVGGAFGLAGTGRFPPVVQEYVGELMCGAGGVGGSEAFGTGSQSQFDDCDTYDLNQGLP